MAQQPPRVPRLVAAVEELPPPRRHLGAALGRECGGAPLIDPVRAVLPRADDAVAHGEAPVEERLLRVSQPRHEGAQPDDATRVDVEGVRSLLPHELLGRAVEDGARAAVRLEAALREPATDLAG